MWPDDRKWARGLKASHNSRTRVVPAAVSRSYHNSNDVQPADIFAEIAVDCESVGRPSILILALQRLRLNHQLQLIYYLYSIFDNLANRIGGRHVDFITKYPWILSLYGYIL